MFWLGVATVHRIVKDTCDAIWDVLQLTYLPEPTKQDWQNIAAGFYNRWNFPNCLGALDGKHIAIQAPARSGSLYHNYKGKFLLNLMALADANYKFTYIDMGEYGSISDGAVFKNSAFGQAFMEGNLDVPELDPLPNYPASGPIPFCFLADDAFPLCAYLM